MSDDKHSSKIRNRPANASFIEQNFDMEYGRTHFRSLEIIWAQALLPGFVTDAGAAAQVAAEVLRIVGCTSVSAASLRGDCGHIRFTSSTSGGTCCVLGTKRPVREVSLITGSYHRATPFRNVDAESGCGFADGPSKASESHGRSCNPLGVPAGRLRMLSIHRKCMVACMPTPM